MANEEQATRLRMLPECIAQLLTGTTNGKHGNDVASGHVRKQFDTSMAASN